MVAILISSALLLLEPPSVPSPAFFVAHRGESADAPENTLAAFNLAWQRGVPAIELDVHLTADDRLIVIHDASTKRTTGVDLLVKESTLDQLSSLDAGSWKGEPWAGEPLPTLEDVLATIPDGGLCLIEVKVGPEAVPALVRAVEASGKSPDQLAVISFNAETLAEAKRQLPDLPMYFLSGFRRDEQTGAWTPSPQALIDQAIAINADGLDLAYRGPIDADFVQRVRDAGLSVHVWTVDDPDDARRFLDLRVDSITTNRAAWLREQLTPTDQPR
ncbi:glycerophosphodiester phosphodiesterase [Tautonia rosea]|uniref:glycerophosphodiester phosphodiesterase n=1 Tax=Tautonia rosea TaxID=2728037 RepID=UPI0028F46084|nr:glycerophosphodiester phosphodiesterase [Tautonia rosea]